MHNDMKTLRYQWGISCQLIGTYMPNGPRNRLSRPSLLLLSHVWMFYDGDTGLLYGWNSDTSLMGLNRGSLPSINKHRGNPNRHTPGASPLRAIGCSGVSGIIQ